MTAIKRVPDVLAAFGRLRDRGVDADALPRRRRARPRRDRAARPDARDRPRRALRRLPARRRAVLRVLRRAPPALRRTRGRPCVAIEALAAGLRSWRRGSAASPDVVDDGVDGLLVAVGDVDAIARRLERLARDPELRRRMGRAGRERVLPATRSSGSSTTSTRCTASCSRRPWPSRLQLPSA